METVVDAVLFVAVHDEEGTEMITFGRTDVSTRRGVFKRELCRAR